MNLCFFVGSDLEKQVSEWGNELGKEKKRQ
jgi:hypothetical protein